MFASSQTRSSDPSPQCSAPTKATNANNPCMGNFAPLHNAAFKGGSAVYLSSACENSRLTGKNLHYFVQGVEKSIELCKIRRIIMLGRPKLSSYELYRLMRQGIGIDFMDIFGRPQGMMSPLADYYFPAQRFQESFHTQPANRLELAKCRISSKIANSCWVLHRRTGVPEALQACAHNAQMAQDFASLRGVEGYAARLYFGLWSSITGDCEFHTRKTYPAPDPINALLSFGYGLLYNRLSAVLARYGLQARMGFFHVGRGRHYALASDLMEDMRASNRNRNKLARFLEKQGRRLQKSVFLVTVTHGRLGQLKQALLELVDAEDELLLVPLCASCQAGMQRSGVVQELALVA